MFTQIFFCNSSIKQLMRFEENDRSWHCITIGLMEKLLFPSIVQVKEIGDDVRFFLDGIYDDDDISLCVEEQIIVDNEGVVNQRLYNSISKFIREKGDNNFKIC